MNPTTKTSGTILTLARRVLADVFGEATWSTWLVLLAAAFGLTLTDLEHAVFERLTGRTQTPAEAGATVREAWFVIGRRAGKSMVAALVAVYQTCCRTYRLAPGERGVFMVIAADRRQARVVKRYISGLLAASPALAARVARETKDAIELTNGLLIEIHTASFRTLRGYTVVGAVADEMAFWPTDDSANPDKEILGALRPAMATIAGALLVVISSPYARRGELWRTYGQHFGKNDSSILVAQAATSVMNPTIDPAIIEDAYAADSAHAAAEYGAEFRRDIESFVAVEVVDAAAEGQPAERPPREGVDYLAFTDPSGGSADAMTLAIVHLEGARVVVDAVREQRPPFSPEQTVTDFATLLKAYRVTQVGGDKYAGEWPRERFAKADITYEPADHPKSDLYRDVLPLLNSGRVALLNVTRLRAQLVGLERRVGRSGRDVIDHAPGGHDDLANAVAGAVCAAARDTFDPVIFDRALDLNLSRANRSEFSLTTIV